MAGSESSGGPLQWEYMEITRKTESYLVNELNELGQEGWEMISVIFHKSSKSGLGSSEVWTGFLKRPYTGQISVGKPAAKIDVAMPSASTSGTLDDDDIFDIKD